MLLSSRQTKKVNRVYTKQLVTTLYNTFLFGSESSLFKLTRRMVRALKKARFPTTTFEGGNKQRIGD